MEGIAGRKNHTYFQAMLLTPPLPSPPRDLLANVVRRRCAISCLDRALPGDEHDEGGLLSKRS